MANYNLLSPPKEFTVTPGSSGLVTVTYKYGSLVLTTQVVRPFNNKITLDPAAIYSKCPNFFTTTPASYIAHSIISEDAVHSPIIPASIEVLGYADRVIRLKFPLTLSTGESVDYISINPGTGEDPYSAYVNPPTPSDQLLYNLDFTTSPGYLICEATTPEDYSEVEIDYVIVNLSGPVTVDSGYFYNAIKSYSNQLWFNGQSWYPGLPFYVSVGNSNSYIKVDGTSRQVYALQSLIVYPTTSLSRYDGSSYVNVPKASLSCPVALTGLDFLGHGISIYTDSWVKSFNRSESQYKLNYFNSRVYSVSPTESFTLTFFKSDYSPYLFSTLRQVKFYNEDYPQGIDCALSVSATDADDTFQISVDILQKPLI